MAHGLLLGLVACLQAAHGAKLLLNSSRTHGLSAPKPAPVELVGVTSDGKFCIPSTRTTKRRPVPLPNTLLSGSGDDWVIKGGNAQRTGTVNISAPRDISLPHWSYYSYEVSYSTPLIDHAGNIFLSLSNGRVESLSPHGDVRWRLQLKGFMPGNPAMRDGILFISDGSGYGWALDTETGKVQWVHRFGETGSAGNYAVSLLGGLVLFHQNLGRTQWTNTSVFIALDTATGNESWRLDVDAPVYNVMPALTDGGRSFIFTDMDGGVHKHESATGLRLWSVPGFPFPLTTEAGWGDQVQGAPRSHSAMALVCDGVVYTAGNPTRRTGRVRALRADTGEELWRHEVDSMMGNSAALADIGGVPTLVFGSGISALHPIAEARSLPLTGTLYAVEALTGQELWRFEADPLRTLMAPGTVLHPACLRGNLPDAWGSPTIDGSGTVYVAFHSGVLYAVDGLTGRLRSRFNSTEGMQSQPAIGPHGELIAVSGMHVHSFWQDSSGTQ